MGFRRTATVTLTVAALAGAAVSAAVAAGDPTPTAPPRMAFVARGDGANFADALAVGSVAGQLGAPVFTTPGTTLTSDTANALADYGPELVVITGGVNAVSAEVEQAVESATGLADDKVVRAAGSTRYGTAAEIADLFDDLGIDPAFLPVGATATDSDLLDGLDSTAFQSRVMWATVDPDGTIVAQSGGVTLAQANGIGGYYLDFGQDVAETAVTASLRYANTGGLTNNDGEITSGVCATANLSCGVPGTNTTEHVWVLTSDSTGSNEPRPFTVTVTR